MVLASAWADGRTVRGGLRSRDYQIFCDEKIYFPMARFSRAWKLRYNIW